MALSSRHALPRHATALLAVALLTGCSLAEEGLWPTLTGEDPSLDGGGETVVIEPSRAEQFGSPLIDPSVQSDGAVGSAAASRAVGATAGVAPIEGAPAAVPVAVGSTPAGPQTGTFVGSKVGNLRLELDNLKRVIAGQNAELQQLLNSATLNSQRYHAVIAAISARLQVGTTPGNPVLVSQWQSAQTELDRVFQDTSRLNELSNRIAANMDMAIYLLESTQASYAIQGAVDEDHRQLAILEDDVNRNIVSIERLVGEVNDSVTRQNNYINVERRNLSALALAVANGEAFGPNLSSVSRAAAARLPQGLAGGAPIGPIAGLPQNGTAAGPIAGRPPLVVIRFDGANVDFEQALYGAVSRTLAQRPSATFDLVAVAPARGGPSGVAASTAQARRHQQDVLRSMLAMGLPAERVNLSSATSGDAATNEVHVYIR